MTGAPEPAGLDWLLGDLAAKTDHVRQAVVLSRDGLALGRSPGLGKDDADHLAALAAAVHSLAHGAGRRFQAGQVRQTIIEMDAALLFISAADEGTCLAVLGDADADAGLIAYEMAMLVKRMGWHLTAEPRPPGQTTSAS